MISKLQTAAWFVLRPLFWRHAVELAARPLRANLDTVEIQADEERWAERLAVSPAEALALIGVIPMGAPPPPSMPRDLLLEAEGRARQAEVPMGGPGDLDLLYAATLLTGAEAVVETGVAYGWSSLTILAAMSGATGRLVSVDMPYVKRANERWIGIVVPQAWRSRWTLIREPDRNGLIKALGQFSGIDLCHYDSDKSYSGRAFAYPLLWEALKPGGVFISDDITDNAAFREFAEASGKPYAITKSAGKYVGIIRKSTD